MTNVLKRRCYSFGMLAFLVGVVIDQITKYLAVVNLKDKEPIILIRNVFQLQYLENRGAAFGIFQNQKVFFVFIGVFMLMIGMFFFTKMPFEKRYTPLRWCLVFIMTGAVGNMIDRVCHNYVIDFLYLSLINFPIFNVADIFVTVATFILLCLILFYYKEEDMDLMTDLLLHRKKGTTNE